MGESKVGARALLRLLQFLPLSFFDGIQAAHFLAIKPFWGNILRVKVDRHLFQQKLGNAVKDKSFALKIALFTGFGFAFIIASITKPVSFMDKIFHVASDISQPLGIAGILAAATILIFPDYQEKYFSYTH